MPSPLRDTAACAAIGAGQSPGTKLISVCGPINRPGVFEVDMGYGLMEFQSHEAGGILNGRALQAVIPGGTQSRSSPLKRPKR